MDTPLVFARVLKDIARTWGRAAVVMATTSLIAVDAAHAIFIDTPIGSPRRIILRVGSANTTVNTVTFNVLNANVSPSPAAVTGVTGGGAPATSPANGIEVNVDARFTNTTGNTVRLTVDSSAGLTCSGGGCGSTIIPFSTISWVSYNQDTNFPGRDIQNGAFNGTSSQSLSNVTWTGGSASNGSTTMSNVLVFQYNNATLFPAGNYTGRVIFTASNL